nr:uncharacterized protein LOC131768632 [Pocillopora verrucosa]
MERHRPFYWYNNVSSDTATTPELVQLHEDSRTQNLEKEIQQLKERQGVLEKRLALKEEDCQRLKSEKEKMESKFKKDKKTITNVLNDNLQRLKQEEESTKKWKDKAEYCSESFEQTRDSFNMYLKKQAAEEQELINSLSKRDEELRVLREQLRDKTVRLAISFEKRLKQDQRRVENTVESNTPSDIEKDFGDFFDGERLDACDDIEFVLGPSGEIEDNVYYPRLACLIFETAYEQVKEARDAACDLFQNVTSQLIGEAPRMCQELCHARKENGASAQLPETFDLLTGRMDEGISTDVLDGMMLSLKETSHLGNLDCFQKDVRKIVWERWTNCMSEREESFLPRPSEDVLTQLGDYIKACIRLTWRMVTQVPPMQLEYGAVQFDKDLHKLARFQNRAEFCRGADHLTGQIIACYLWPALLESGGRTIFLGEVMCEPESYDYVMIPDLRYPELDS